MADYKVERELIKIEINTHVPTKWRLLDLETGEVWRRHESGSLVPATDIRYARIGGKGLRQPNGFGTIHFRRSDGRWCAMYRFIDPVTGIGKRKSLYGSTENEVENKLIAAFDKMIEGLS